LQDEDGADQLLVLTDLELRKFEVMIMAGLSGKPAKETAT
jgi:hypothetical protein